MRNDLYPLGTVQALMQTGKVTSNTRSVLQSRLKRKYITEPRFFDAEIFITLRAVCMRLIPQNDPNRMIDLAGCLDGVLAEGKGNGWRYDVLPPDGKSFIIGLNGINRTAVSLYGKKFYLVGSDEQDEILTTIQTGRATGLTWQIIPAKLFFEEILAALVELYYSHPYAKEEIGEVSFADAKGWQKVGLNQLEEHEPGLVGWVMYADT